jgi:trehalose 6-phosphate synthase/phosphatase
MQALRRRVRTADVHAWASGFLEALREATPPAPARVDPGALLGRLRRAPARVLLLDYDGTLVPLTPRPEQAAPDPELLALLGALAAQPTTEVHVVSGRPRETLQAWLGGLPIGLHAEHGLWSRPAPHRPWRRLEDVPTAWTAQVRPLLETFARLAPGAFVEEKSASLAWHHRQVEPARGAALAAELAGKLRALLVAEDLADTLELMPGSKVLEVRPRAVHKGRVVPEVLEGAPRTALLAAFGDDRTDEDLFAALPAGAAAVHVGPLPSAAPLRLADPAALRALLRALLPAGLPEHAAPP